MTVRSRLHRDVLTQGLDRQGDVTSVIVRLGVQRLVQEVLEEAATDYLERGDEEKAERCPELAE